VPGTDREPGIARLLRIRLALVVEEHVSARRLRSRLAVVDGDGLARLGDVDEHEAAAADIAGPRQGHSECEADCHRRINRVAAALQEIDADAGRLRLLRCHHAVLGDDRQVPRRVRQDGLAARHAGWRALRKSCAR
jgi:hypothetical protein